MKKLFILILIPFFLSGCYDYNELNKLAIVTTIGIDYVDEEYQVTLEILSTKKEGENNTSTKNYTVTKTAKNLVEALDATSDSLDKVVYYGHLELLMIDEEIAKNHLDIVTDHLTRCPRLRNEFYSVIVKNSSVKKVLESTTPERPVISTYVLDLLENSKESSNAGYYVPYTGTLNDILTEGTDTKMSVFELNDNELGLVGMGLFHKYRLQKIVSNDTARIINLLNNFDVRDITFSHECSKDHYTVLSIYKGKTDISSDEKQIKVKTSLEAWIKEENCAYNLREEKSYEELQKIFSEVIKKEILDTINDVKNSKTNVLNLGKSYYIKTRKKDYFKWLNQEVAIEVDLKINKKGLTFQIEEE